jgi:regulator of cell morphogenesis and NO signaling
MMTISSNKPVREIALEMPEATRILEKMKIDYCCGGDKPLGEACATAGVDVDELMRMLEGAKTETGNGSTGFQNSTLGELITHIIDKHHVYTKDEITRLQALSEKVFSAHGQNHPELSEIRRQLQMLSADLTQHMFKEEQILFPYIGELERSVMQSRPAPFAPFGTVNNPVRMMMVEHDTAGEILRELRKLSSDYTVPADACISYQTFYQALEAFEQDLHQHIHLENNLLFPRAIEMEGGR